MLVRSMIFGLILACVAPQTAPPPPPERSSQMVLPEGAVSLRKEIACAQGQGWIKRELKAAYIAQKSYMAEYDLYSGFDIVGFKPPEGGRYTICNNSQDCRPCTAKNLDGTTSACGAVGPKLIACTQPIGYGEGENGRPYFRMCGTGNLDDDDTLDVWSIDDANNLINEVNDCEE